MQSEEKITISRERYDELVRQSNVDKELLQDIARGIKDILEGNVKEI